MSVLLRREASLIIAALVAACSTSATSPGTAPTLVERSRVSMGSELHLTAWTTDEANAAAAFEAVFAEFDRLDGLLSVWREGSDIVRLNANAGIAPVPISRETREILLDARQISEWTGGKFDVTFGALSGLWKFDHDLDGTIPSREEVAAKLPLIDYRKLVIDETAGTAFLTMKGMRAHLGGIGKGFAVDRGVAILRERGLRDFMLQSGGDMYVAGMRGDRPWRLGLRDPRGPADQSFATIELTDAALSTSGDYERFFMKDGRRYHHIIDPALGEPARGTRSVTIIATRSTVADALDTGVFLLGPDRGMALIERLPGVEGVIVSEKNNVLVSSALKNRLVMKAPPTDAP